MQVMTMLAMDRPDSLDGDELRDEKVSTVLDLCPELPEFDRCASAVLPPPATGQGPQIDRRRRPEGRVLLYPRSVHQIQGWQEAWVHRGRVRGEQGIQDGHVCRDGLEDRQ